MDTKINIVKRKKKLLFETLLLKTVLINNQ